MLSTIFNKAAQTPLHPAKANQRALFLIVGLLLLFLLTTTSKQVEIILGLNGWLWFSTTLREGNEENEEEDDEFHDVNTTIEQIRQVNEMEEAKKKVSNKCVKLR